MPMRASKRCAAGPVGANCGGRGCSSTSAMLMMFLRMVISLLAQFSQGSARPACDLAADRPGVAGARLRTGDDPAQVGLVRGGIDVAHHERAKAAIGFGEMLEVVKILPARHQEPDHGMRESGGDAPVLAVAKAMERVVQDIPIPRVRRRGLRVYQLFPAARGALS